MGSDSCSVYRLANQISTTCEVESRPRDKKCDNCDRQWLGPVDGRLLELRANQVIHLHGRRASNFQQGHRVTSSPLGRLLPHVLALSDQLRGFNRVGHEPSEV